MDLWLITSDLNSLYIWDGPLENLWGGRGGRSTKKNSRKRKLNEKNSCTPINPKKFKPCPKKIHTRNFIAKKNSCSSKIPHPHHNFSSGLSLMASYSKRMVNLLIIMYICHDPFTFSCNRKSEQQESLKRDFLHHTGTQKIPSVSPPSNSSGKRFQINCKMPVYEERDPDCHERLEKLWWCLRSNRKQDSMWSWVVCFSAAICNALNLGFVLSFGVLFPVLLDYFNETKERTGE